MNAVKNVMKVLAILVKLNLHLNVFVKKKKMLHFVEVKK